MSSNFRGSKFDNFIIAPIFFEDVLKKFCTDFAILKLVKKAVKNCCGYISNFQSFFFKLKYFWNEIKLDENLHLYVKNNFECFQIVILKILSYFCIPKSTQIVASACAVSDHLKID